MSDQVPRIGCVADDYTGATDLAGLLRRSGMRVVQCFGIPQDRRLVRGYDAIVVALKTRSIPAEEACDQSCRAAAWLRSLGAPRLFFKYCSTFDSTDRGNIGPVAEALMQQLQVDQTIFCPAFPENGRTVYNGHLFVGQRLLSESGMENHPLNPMRDANLVRVLAAQSQLPVGLLALGDLTDGPGEVQRSLDALPPLVVADAINDRHLATLARAVVDHPLVTGGSAIAGQIAGLLRERGEVDSVWDDGAAFPSGPAAIVSGSCSRATLQQVAAFSQSHPVLHLDVVAIARDRAVVEQAKTWIADHLDQCPLLITTSTDPESLRSIQTAIGRHAAAAVAEDTLGQLAAQLVDLGVVRMVVAGGETSGAVTQRLGIEAIRIGPEIAPGVPWTLSLGRRQIALALKSGNFGSENFFQEALDLLD